MNILRKILAALFGEPGDRHQTTQGNVDYSDLPSAPICAYCRQLATQMPITEDGEGHLHPPAGYHSFTTQHWAHVTGLWTCTCTAVGSGAWAPDLDEAADLLLELLGIESAVSQPSVPVDESGLISVQRYDVHETEHALDEILNLHGWELRRNAYRQKSVPIQCLWIRQNDGPSAIDAAGQNHSNRDARKD